MINLNDRAKHIRYSKIGSYKENDVIFLLKDLSNLIIEQGTEEREGYIQGGGHYSEMIPIEYVPSKEYMDLFYRSLKKDKAKIAKAVAVVSELIYKKNGNEMVLVSLARAGTPAGILIKRYLNMKYGLDLPHYSVSIIRDKGIDENAIIYILQNNYGKKLQFIDGWTGKGTILNVLSEACNDFKLKYNIHLDDDLAVIADPGKCVRLYGTREDFLIPSACLNSTVSGLVSRTVLRDDLIGKHDFHGAKFYRELEKDDVSNFFIDEISNEFGSINVQHSDFNIDTDRNNFGLADVEKIQTEFGIKNINFVKPGIGETTRVLLRRMPWMVLIKEDTDVNDSDGNLSHILLLAKEKHIQVIRYPLMCYQCCGIIRPLREA